MGLGTSSPPEHEISGGWILTLPQTWDATGNGRQVGGTHTTGMLSCFHLFLVKWLAKLIWMTKGNHKMLSLSSSSVPTTSV